MKRRNFVKASSTIAATALMTGLYAWQIEPFWIDFEHVKMPVKNLPKKLIGKRIMQISDVHVGNDFELDFLINAFEKAKRYKPDFVFYTGDFISYVNAKQFKQLTKVFKHAVKGKMGTFGVLGNHDYGYRWSQIKVANAVTKILRKSGIGILSNEKVNIRGLNIIGLDDYWSPRYNPRPILRTVNKRMANIVLCHNPDVCDLNVWNNYDGWILSGHTHGGQCKPPFLKPPILPVKNKRYTSGKFDFEDGRTLYINRALGHSKQIRFNVRPEITLFKLDKIQHDGT
ncbi:MAG: phosphoesterase [Saprospiraceae bacterium]|nr:phosphoesterase [Saprospiraceae bacterium]NNL92530.1 phosphoesterase [Saprospiraceae bacterium]